MMESHIQDWLGLVLRWGHFIAGVAWIGASFYFNWLENHLERANAHGRIAGDLWAVHGGGFYYLQKFAVAPESEPPVLHWFKWEAYTTWLTGFALLCVVYYWNAQAYMTDPAGLGPAAAVAAGLASLLLSWLFYDGLCRSRLAEKNAVLSGLVMAWFIVLAWLLDTWLSGRAAYIHVGAAIGTVMVANVFFVIIPAQKELVSALRDARQPDGTKGKRALQRSRHNNYFTLPVLFIMVSGHYPSTYGHDQAWLLLALLSIAGVSIRHWFNIRHRENASILPLSLGIALLLVLSWSLRPVTTEAPQTGAAPGTDAIFAIVRQRCAGCHAASPENQMFGEAPLGIELDTPQALARYASQVYRASVVTRTMPLGNLSGMTEDERRQVAAWFEPGRTGETDP